MLSSVSKSRRNSILLAAAIAIVLVVWLASGLGGDAPTENARPGAAARTEAVPVTVTRSRAERTERTISVSARTAPDRVVEIKAETEGRVVAIGAERGAVVAEGDLIAELDMRDREARLEEARALVRQRELEFEAADRLRDDSFLSAAELAAAEAALVAARAARERIELDIARTRIEAQFDAVIFDRHVEIGDYIGVGDRIADVVDSDPLIVIGNLNESDVGELAAGSPGIARLLGGTKRQGTVRYLAPLADESTRSFRIELAIPNPDHGLRVGTSAELVLDAEEITAHRISPALLALADDGRIGVKVVDDTNHVQFLEVELAASTNDGVLVTGLPPEVRIITVGQGFVTDGQAVDPVESSASPATTDERTY